MSGGLDLQGLIERAQQSMAPKSPGEVAAAKQAALHDAMIVWRALDNPNGKALLDLLYRKFGEPVIFDATLGFENGAALGFFRSGQTKVLNWLGQMIERARDGGVTPENLKKLKRRKS